MRSFPNSGWHPLVVWLATAFVGGLIGGFTAVSVIGIDPHPFRSLPAQAGSSLEKPCIRYDLRGERIGPC